MKLKSLNRADNFSFGLIALLVLIGSGLLLSIQLPDIKSWQISQSDKIINLAGQSSGQARVNLLEQAALVNNGDPLATEYLAEYYRSIGDYKKAIATYQSSDSSNNAIFLGNLALMASDFNLAKSLFAKSDRAEQTAESLSGLALVDFATNQNAAGCDKASQAKKLNLSSTTADRVVVICQIQSGKSEITARRQAYLLAESYLYTRAIEKLQAVKTKSSGDWALLAQLYKATGDKSSSEQAISNGLSQDPTNKYLLEAKAEQLQNAGNTTDAKIIQARIKDLEFSNFQ